MAARPWELVLDETPGADYLPWSPAGVDAIAESIARQNNFASATNHVLNNGELNLQPVYLPAGRTVSRTHHATGSVAAVNITNQWVCLIDAITLGVLAVSADQVAAAPWAINSLITNDFTVPYRPLTDMRAYIGIVQVNAVGSNNSWRGGPNIGNPALLAPVLCGYSSVGLTNPASLPNPVAAPIGGFLLWAALS